MKLIKTTFDKLDVGDECLFANDKNEIILCEKKGKDAIVVPLRLSIFDGERRTGMLHEVWKIEK